MIKSYCENQIHENNEILLESYKEIDQGRLLICKDCGTLYYHNTDLDILARLREESVLISNIDSPNEYNSTKCDCGKLMYRASDCNKNGRAWYYCLDCNHMYFK